MEREFYANRTIYTEVLTGNKKSILQEGNVVQNK